MESKRITNILSLISFLGLVIVLVVLIYSHLAFSSNWIIITVQIMAFLLMLWARITFGSRSFHASANPTDGGLITTGPYRFFRHPIYAAVFYFIWAGAIGHFSVLSIALAITATFFIGVRIYAEEMLLKEKYPDYSAYAAKTKRIIPYIL